LEHFLRNFRELTPCKTIFARSTRLVRVNDAAMPLARSAPFSERAAMAPPSS
jgi:hypothetical protein